MNDTDVLLFRLFVIPAAIAATIAVAVSIIAKFRGQRFVPISMILIWLVAISVYVVFRNPAPAIALEVEPFLTLKWDAAFSIAVGLVLSFTALPIWYLANSWPFYRAVIAAVIVSSVAGFFLGPMYYIVLCVLRGTCDP